MGGASHRFSQPVSCHGTHRRAVGLLSLSQSFPVLVKRGGPSWGLAGARQCEGSEYRYYRTAVGVVRAVRAISRLTRLARAVR